MDNSAYLLVKRLEDEKEITLFVGDNKNNGMVINKETGYVSSHGILNMVEQMEIMCHCSSVLKGIFDKQSFNKIGDLFAKVLKGGESGEDNNN